jgi:nitroreductase
MASKADTPDRDATRTRSLFLAAGIVLLLQGFSHFARMAVLGSAMGFVWLSGRNGRSDQVHAGRARVRMQLKAAELGLGVHPMSQALQEFPELAPHCARAHQLMLERPAPASPAEETLQMFCRLGYTAEPVPATPRRALNAFVRA